MNRTLVSIAIAAATTLGAASSFAGSFPASGEFSAADQPATEVSTVVAHTERANASVLAQAMPAAGEFSAADAPVIAGPGLTREQVRQALASARAAQPAYNGEIVEAYAAPSTHTRQAIRQEGQLALRTGQIPAGELTL